MSTFKTKRIADFRLRAYPRRASLTRVSEQEYALTVISTETGRLVSTVMIEADSQRKAKQDMMAVLDEEYPAAVEDETPALPH